MLECVLRPAFVHLEVPQQGYAVSIYVKALGESPQRASKLHGPPRSRTSPRCCAAIRRS